MGTARIGLIIPSSNRLTEPQFHHYAPVGVGIHVTRLRMTGKWRRQLAELKAPIADAAAALGDVKPGVVVFHCTASSMEAGLDGEKAVIETIAAIEAAEQKLGKPVVTSNQATLWACLRRLGLTPSLRGLGRLLR